MELVGDLNDLNEQGFSEDNVQSRERLVKQQQPRLHGQRPCQCHSLLFPGREAMGKLAGLRVDVASYQHGPGAHFAFTAWQLHAGEAQQHVLHCREVWPETQVLENHSNAPFMGWNADSAAIKSNPPVHKYFATARGVQAAGQAQQGRFSRTRRPGHKHVPASAEGKINAGQNRPSAKSLAYVS